MRATLGSILPPPACTQLPPNPAFSQQLEVSQLEGSLQQPKAQSAMSPYLVPDTQALCHHLPVIRQLATSGRFIVIIPRTGKCTGEVGAQSVAERESGLGLRDPWAQLTQWPWSSPATSLNLGHVTCEGGMTISVKP